MDLVEASKEAQRVYLRAWRKKHRAKVSEYNKRYWEKKAEKALKTRDEGDLAQ